MLTELATRPGFRFTADRETTDTIPFREIRKINCLKGRREIESFHRKASKFQFATSIISIHSPINISRQVVHWKAIMRTANAFYPLFTYAVFRCRRSLQPRLTASNLFTRIQRFRR